MSNIELISAALTEYYGRPLRLLDLGGVSDVQECVSRINPQEFDVVLGYELSNSLIDQLLNQVDVLLFMSDFENDSQGKSTQLLSHIPFVRNIGLTKAPSSDIQHTLFYCSSKIWYFNKSVARFTDSFRESHEYACGTHQGSRSYFLGKDLFAKMYRLNGDRGEINRAEFECEISVLNKLADLRNEVLFIPRLVDFEQLDDIAYIVTERIPGRRLTEIIEHEESYDPVSLVGAVLKQLVELEKRNLYYNDLRLWNILVDEKGQARLIDFGSISEKRQDVVWPHNIFASFLIFVAEVQWMKEPRVYPYRRPMFSPVWSQKDLQNFCNKIWSTPYTNWSFGLFDQYLTEVLKDVTKSKMEECGIPAENLKFWMAVNESLVSLASSFFLYEKIMVRTQEAEAKAQEAEAKTRQSEEKAEQAQIAAQEAASKAKSSEQKAQNAQIIAQQAEIKSQEAEIRFQKAEIKAQSLEKKKQQVEAEYKQSKVMMRQFFQEYCNNEVSFFVPLTWFFRKKSPPEFSDVIAAYRYFLERNPESESVVLQHIHIKTVGELIDSFKNSQEHKVLICQRSLNKAKPVQFSVVIKKLIGYPYLILLFLFIWNRPAAKAKMRRWIKKFPLLAKFWQKLDWNQSTTMEQERIMQLTPRALQIYGDLKAAIEDYKKEKVDANSN